MMSNPTLERSFARAARTSACASEVGSAGCCSLTGAAACGATEEIQMLAELIVRSLAALKRVKTKCCSRTGRDWNGTLRLKVEKCYKKKRPLLFRR